MIAKPTTGPRITRANEEIKDLLMKKLLDVLMLYLKTLKLKKL